VLYVDDDWLRRRWALAEAARVERLLHDENDEVLLYVINDLGLQVKTAGRQMDNALQPVPTSFEEGL
jgi:hypothetical protein